MTLQNIKYIIAVADCQSLSAAAKELFISQSTLSAAVKELESELGVKLFLRNNRGVSLTADGTDFLRYAREIAERADSLEQRYQHRRYAPMRFAVSAQRLPFVVRAFNRFMRQIGWDTYDVAIRECPTYTIISDVTAGKSDLGVLVLHDQYLPGLQKSFSTSDVVFTELGCLQTYAFLRKGHPLSGQESVTMAQLLQYPFVTYDQEADRSEYTEEIIFYQLSEKTIHVCDRGSKLALIRATDAFSVGPDLPNSNADAFHKSMGKLVAIPVDGVGDLLHVGYIRQRHGRWSDAAELYLQYLTEEVRAIRDTHGLQRDSLQQEDKRAPVDSTASVN